MITIVLPAVSTSTACSKRNVLRKQEELLEHFDHVIVCMFVVVEQDHVVERCVLFAIDLRRFRYERRGGSHLLHRCIQLYWSIPVTGSANVCAAPGQRRRLRRQCAKTPKPRYNEDVPHLGRGRNGFDGIESLCEGVSGSELP